jgi:hypothetical protein
MSPNLKIFSRLVLFLSFFLAISDTLFAQNYESVNSGNWTTAANWSRISGCCSNFPISGQTNGTTNVNHNMTFTGNYSSGSATININAGNTMSVNGSFAVGGGSNVNVYGTLEISGSATLNSLFRIFPGGRVIIDGNLTVVSSNNLVVGTSVAPPPYADLVVKGNLISQTSGDVTINQNGRVAIYGDVTAAGGGTLFRVNNGGQVYVDGDITFTGGGSQIINNNTTSPYGLYVNGTEVNSGGGSSVTTNRGEKDDLINSNPNFFDWIANQEDSPLPVELLFFNALINEGSVLLAWATASQLNFDYFSVEHSTDGFVWNEISRIKGEGTTQNRDEYNLKNVRSLSGNNYYRLKLVDLDGTFAFSKVLVITMDDPKDISIYPNPVNQSEMIAIELNFLPNDGDRIMLYNSFGVELMNFTITATKLSVPLSDLKAGTYIVKYVSANSAPVSRLVVQ